MELWRDGLIAFLAAVGVAAIFYLLAGHIFRLHTAAPADAALILAVKGHEPRLEKKIRRLQEAAWGMKAVPRIVVVDCGMEEATLRAAKDLAAWDTTFTLCSKEELEKILFELTKQETQRV